MGSIIGLMTIVEPGGKAAVFKPRINVKNGFPVVVVVVVVLNLAKSPFFLSAPSSAISLSNDSIFSNNEGMLLKISW